MEIRSTRGIDARKSAIFVRQNPRVQQSLVLLTLQAVQGLEFDLPRMRGSRAEGDARNSYRQESVTVVFEPCTGDVAQLGEHLLCTQGVTGSSPVISTSTLSTE